MGKAGTKRIVLLGIWVALLAGVIIAINVMGRAPATAGDGTPPPHPLPKLDPVKLEAEWPQIVAQAAAPPRGLAGARYTIAEFGDFQCPQCGAARPLLEKMLTQYPAQVNLIFLHRPFSNIHEWALPSGQASEIAAAQGKFWPMYDVLYAHQDNLEPGFYSGYAAQAGLDRAQFKTAYDAGQGIAQVKASSKFADDLHIELTPTILVRDNAAKTVAVYIGMSTKGNINSGSPYLGLDKLVAAPPWAK